MQRNLFGLQDLLRLFGHWRTSAKDNENQRYPLNRHRNQAVGADPGYQIHVPRSCLEAMAER